MRRRLLSALALCAGTLYSAADVHAQIRPLDPAPWSVFEHGNNLLLEAGVGVLHGQRASLAGTRGELQELGLYGITWRTGRVALKASGTAFWRMRNEDQVEAAQPGVGAVHTDPGAVLVETAARLTPDDATVLWLLRFGTRLPITSLVSGLDRDENDFFALLGLRTRGPWWVAAEAGAAIQGRAHPASGQTDVLVYTAGAGFTGSRIPLRVDAWVVGHDDLHRGVVRGNEDLRELRVGVRSRGRLWAGAQWIHGLGEFSPSNGVRIMIGMDADLSRTPLLGWE